MRRRLLADHAIDARSSVRLDFIHERSSFNEWTWRNDDVAFFCSDDTTVDTQENRRSAFPG